MAEESRQPGKDVSKTSDQEEGEETTPGDSGGKQATDKMALLRAYYATSGHS